MSQADCFKPFCGVCMFCGDANRLHRPKYFRKTEKSSALSKLYAHLRQCRSAKCDTIKTDEHNDSCQTCKKRREILKLVKKAHLEPTEKNLEKLRELGMVL